MITKKESEDKEENSPQPQQPQLLKAVSAQIPNETVKEVKFDEEEESLEVQVEE